MPRFRTRCSGHPVGSGLINLQAVNVPFHTADTTHCVPGVTDKLYIHSIQHRSHRKL